MKQPSSLVGMIFLSSAVATAASAQETPPVEYPQSIPSSSNSTAQADGAESLAKELSNPVASLISVPFQENIDFGAGLADDGMKSTLNVQPVIPIGITPKVNLIIRTILPVVYQNNLRGDNVSDFGLGDTVQTFFVSPKEPTASGIIWGVGPVLLYPTATSKYTGGRKWGGGPSIVVLKQFGPTTIGFLGNHIWSLAGDDDRPDVSASFLQPFVSYTTKRATTFSLNTESTYDWKSKQWSVPINFSVSQLMRIGKQPVSIGIGGRYYFARPQFGPDWGVRLITTLLFPKG